MDLMEFMKTAELYSLPKLDSKLIEIIRTVIFLSDFRLISEEEIEMNNSVFQWYHRMPKILDNNKIMMENKLQEFQEVLKGCEKFL